MKLAQLFSIYPEYRVGDAALQDVLGLTLKSSEVRPGFVFVAVKGATADGHDHLPEAIANGALALVVGDLKRIPQDYRGAVLVSSNTRAELHALASAFYQHPADDLFCVGITGTNGKTSTSYFCECVLGAYGWPTGVMGTINHHLGTQHWQTHLTTPDAITLHKRLAEMRAMGARAVAFEVSSHALEQGRADSIPLDVAVFTNLTRDHLDYHKTMENYFAAKNKIFEHVLASSHKKNRAAIVNIDDSYGRRIAPPNGIRLITFGRTQADLSFKVLSMQFSGSNIQLEWQNKTHEFHLPMPGLMNVYNAVGALAVGLAAGESLSLGMEAIGRFAGVPGRLQSVPGGNGRHVFVDYAHTDDALRSVLRSLDDIRKTSEPSSKIICVFGCGGDRDRGKRPLMLSAALEFADAVFVTSDNPRSEDPEKIIDEILQNLPRELLDVKVFREVDRKQAIARSLQMAAKNDVVLIAGKGHENYQIIGSTTLEFSDAEVAQTLMNS